MLSQIYATHSQKFDALASAWLAVGATSFALIEYEQVIAKWPQYSQHADDFVSVPIKCMGLTLGGLQVSGLNGPDTTIRLHAEAEFISHYIMMEGELEGLTNELIEMQDQLLALYDVARATRNQLSINEAVASITQATAQMFHVEAVFAWIQLPNHPLLVEQNPKNKIPHSRLEELFTYVADTNENFLSNGNDITKPLPEGIRNALVCPIRINNSIVAAIGLVNRIEQQFTTPDLKLIETVSQQAEAHLENVLLHENSVAQAKMQTEMEMAKDVQLHLLPQSFPHVDDLDIAAQSTPALQVGGDFFDFVQIPKKPLIFTVGDVSGKGMSSALIMAMTRTVMRSSIRLLAQPCPQEILDRTNEELFDDFSQVAMFATIFVGAYVPGSKKLVYANAGHSPVIYCPVDGPAVMLEADGTAVGVLPENPCENRQIDFRQGDVLLVATDGFSEARSPEGEFFGYDRLLELAKSLAHLPAQAIMDELYSQINAFSDDSPQADDQTIIIIKGK